MLFQDAIAHLTTTVKLVDLCDKLKIDTKLSGTETSAICQFHDDTQPSMKLYDENPKGGSKYHCFSCNAHGNVFELVKRVQGLDFTGAVHWLAKEYGITIEKPSFIPEVVQNDLLSTIINDIYLYTLELYKKNQDNNEIISYLEDDRAYNSSIISKADLSLTCQKNLITLHLAKLNLSDPEKLIIFDEFEKSGLIKKSLFENKSKNQYLPLAIELQQSYYDHFSPGRLLFPLQNEAGKILGFSGRITSKEIKGPKYLFTKGLKKADLLYRSHQAFKNIQNIKTKEKLIPLYVCEGLFDALRLESLGLNAVAILGADLSANQTKLICNLSEKSLTPINVCLFLDNDNAGITASANAIKNLYKKSDPSSLELMTLHDSSESKVDPDSYLRSISEQQKVNLELNKIICPVPALFLASQIGVTPKLIRDNSYWNDLPYSQRFRAAIEWKKIFDNTNRSAKQVLKTSESTYQNEDWFIFLNSIDSGKKASYDDIHGNFLTDTSSRVQHAIKLAQSSGLSSALPNDIAEWRRLDMSAIAVELILDDRFNLNSDLKPIEPLNTIKFSRKIADTEPRIMHMHCAEDLIAHQYILNELLTESYDNNPLINGKRLSDCIPTARFYGNDKTTLTTGRSERDDVTLSFAYQINMDVLEGAPPKKEGMFRTYFDSWKDFTTSIATAAQKMPLVHMVRLDLKRYYDQLKRYVVQDALRECIPENLFDISEFAPLITDANRTKDHLINWLLEQSFGFDYYDPKSGEISTSNPLMGIPQGPDLSSFLANMVLFTIDNIAREFIESQKLKSDNYHPAWYARYVDDMVIIADNAASLSLFRSTLEDAIKKLQLEIVAKEQPGPKKPEDFLKYLGKGKALAASGPTGVEPLVSLDDIQFIDKIERYQALGLLNDRSLYAAKSETIITKINMAANSEELRLSDLKKITKWLWYAATLNNLTSDPSTDMQLRIIDDFLNEWIRVAQRFHKQLTPIECTWEDPLLIALEGLKSTFEAFDWVNDELTNDQKFKKDKVRDTLVNLVSNQNLIKSLAKIGTTYKILGWAISINELKRTYWQKIVYLKWEATKLNKVQNVKSSISKSSKTDALAKSLKRVAFTNAELSNSDIILNEISNENILHQICILLQEIYFYLGQDEEDSLRKAANKILNLRSKEPNSKTLDLFSTLITDGDKS